MILQPEPGARDGKTEKEGIPKGGFALGEEGDESVDVLLAQHSQVLRLLHITTLVKKPSMMLLNIELPSRFTPPAQPPAPGQSMIPGAMT